MAQKAEDFFWNAYQYLKTQPGFNSSKLSLTGHSLGGMLAKIIGLDFNIHAVAFNSPGVANLQTNVSLPTHSNILNVNSKEGKINKIGQSVGDQVQVSVSQGNLACEIANIIKLPVEETRCIYEKHNVENLVQAIESTPKVAQIRF